MIERCIPIPARTVNFRQGMVTGSGPSLIPRRFVEGRISVVITLEVAQAQAKVIVGFAIVRIRIASRQSFDSSTKVRFGFREFTMAEMPQAHRIVAAGVQWVSMQRFAPVKHGRTCGVAVLIKMQPSNVELVSTRDVRRCGRLDSRWRNLAFHARPGPMRN